MIIKEIIISTNKGIFENFYWLKIFLTLINHPAFLRFFTKKSFSLVRTLSLDFSNSFLISGFKFFFVLFKLIKFELKINYKDFVNISVPKKKLWIVFLKKRKYFILHIEIQIHSTNCGKPCWKTLKKWITLREHYQNKLFWRNF